MHQHPSARSVSSLAAVAVVGALLVAAPAAQAAPVFDDSQSTLRTRSETSPTNGNCNTTNTASTTTTTQPVVENGAATSFSRIHTAAWVNNDDLSDRGNTTASLSGSVKTSSVGTGSFSVDFASEGAASMTADKATSGCTELTFVRAYADLPFTVAQAGWLTIDVSNRGYAYTESTLRRTPDGNALDVSYGQDIKLDSSSRVFVAAGTYSLYIEGKIQLRSNTARSVTGSSAVHTDFALAGSQSSAPDGKGKRFVKFPAARNCQAHELTPTISGPATRANKIRSVKFFVNDRPVARVEKPSAGRAVPLSIADADAADVRALVKLKKTKRGVPAKKFEVTASYLACS